MQIDKQLESNLFLHHVEENWSEVNPETQLKELRTVRFLFTYLYDLQYEAYFFFPEPGAVPSGKMKTRGLKKYQDAFISDLDKPAYMSELVLQARKFKLQFDAKQLFDKRDKFLVLSGPSASGKTVLSEAIGKYHKNVQQIRQFDVEVDLVDTFADSSEMLYIIDEVTDVKFIQEIIHRIEKPSNISPPSRIIFCTQNVVTKEQIQSISGHRIVNLSSSESSTVAR